MRRKPVLVRSLSTPTEFPEEHYASGFLTRRFTQTFMAKAKSSTAKQPKRFTPIVVIVFGVVLIAAMILHDKRPKGTCDLDHAYRRITCNNKHLQTIPTDITDDALILIFGHPLNKAENHFTSICPGNFSRFHQLQELVLVKCGIEEIQPSTFKHVASTLRSLDLRYNRIQSLTESALQGLTNLDYLYLSNNPLQMLEDFIFRRIRIEYLQLTNNPALVDITDKAFAGAIIKTLMISRCRLGIIRAGTFSYISESLEEVTISHNMQPLNLAKTVFQSLKLRLLDLQNNGLEQANFLEFVYAENVTLDDNPLEDLDFDDYSSVENIKYLSIRRTKIRSITFENLSLFKKLEELHLEGNYLTVLSANDFAHLPQLRLLNLANNDIVGLEGDFESCLKTLHTLYLHNNDIQTLPLSLAPLFENLHILTLNGNPLHCNCEVRWLIAWMKVQPGVLQDNHLLQCETPTNQNFTMVSDYGFQCRPPAILNATFDSDGVSLVCTADGDPPPKVTWVTPYGQKQETPPPVFKRGSFQTQSYLPISKDGNYTCIAESLAGTETITVDTKTIPTSGLRFVVHSQKIQILETPHGFFITAVLIAILGYIFRQG